MQIENSSATQLPDAYRATIARFLNAPELTQFVKTMREIESLGADRLLGYPTHNYFALNFKNDSPANFKIYFSFLRKLSFDEILRVLPTTVDIEPYYHLFQESKVRDINHTGFSLAIKIDQSLKATYQVHFRFLYSPILPQPKFVKLSRNDYKFTQGISFEYTGAQTFRKNYYYLNGSSAYKAVLSKFSGPDRNHLIEYTETDKWTKVIHWFYDFLDVRDYIRSSMGRQSQKFVSWIESEYGVTAICPGVYDDQTTRSIYFFAVKPQTCGMQGFYGTSNIETVNQLYSRLQN